MTLLLTTILSILPLIASFFKTLATASLFKSKMFAFLVEFNPLFPFTWGGDDIILSDII